jgi:hypothetical protein
MGKKIILDLCGGRGGRVHGMDFSKMDVPEDYRDYVMPFKTYDQRRAAHSKQGYNAARFCRRLFKANK